MTPRRTRLSVPPCLRDHDQGHLICSFLYPDVLRGMRRRAAYIALIGPKSCQMRRLADAWVDDEFNVLHLITLFLH